MSKYKFTRRNFLKLSSSAIAGTLLAPIWPWPGSAYAHFDKSDMWGDYVLIKPADFNRETYREAVQLLSEQIADFVPPIYRKQIVAVIKMPGNGDPWNLNASVGWEYVPKKMKRLNVAA